MSNWSGSAACFFLLHAFANQIRAGEDAKIASFPSYEIHQSDSVGFLQVSQIEDRP